MIVGVIGAGAWGTALAHISARSGNDVLLWSYDGLYKSFDGVSMSDRIRITSDVADLRNSDIWLVVTPAAFFRETVRKMREFYAGQPILICTKGMEGETGQFMSEILNEEIPECQDVGVLSGPQFAREVATGIPNITKLLRKIP